MLSARQPAYAKHGGLQPTKLPKRQLTQKPRSGAELARQRPYVHTALKLALLQMQQAAQRTAIQAARDAARAEQREAATARKAAQAAADAAAKVLSVHTSGCTQTSTIVHALTLGLAQVKQAAEREATRAARKAVRAEAPGPVSLADAKELARLRAKRLKQVCCALVLHSPADSL